MYFAIIDLSALSDSAKEKCLRMVKAYNGHINAENKAVIPCHNYETAKATYNEFAAKKVLC